MHSEDFEKSMRKLLDNCESLMRSKGDGYSLVSNRLSAFVKASQMQGVSEKQALAGMMAKHTTSLYDMLASEGEYVRDVWREKIMDHMNYLILLNAIIDAEYMHEANNGVNWACDDPYSEGDD